MVTDGANGEEPADQSAKRRGWSLLRQVACCPPPPFHRPGLPHCGPHLRGTCYSQRGSSISDSCFISQPSIPSASQENEYYSSVTLVLIHVHTLASKHCPIGSNARRYEMGSRPTWTSENRPLEVHCSLRSSLYSSPAQPLRMPTVALRILTACDEAISELPVSSWGATVFMCTPEAETCFAGQLLERQ